jgi:hypothetical protein
MNTGSRFTVRLPRYAGVIDRQVMAAIRGEVVNLQGIRVLVVDDDAESRAWPTRL